MSKLKGMKYVRLLKLTEEEVAKEAEQYENTNPYKKVEVQKAAPEKGGKQTFLKGLTKGVKKLVTTKLEDLQKPTSYSVDKIVEKLIYDALITSFRRIPDARRVKALKACNHPKLCSLLLQTLDLDQFLNIFCQIDANQSTFGRAKRSVQPKFYDMLALCTPPFQAQVLDELRDKEVTRTFQSRQILEIVGEPVPEQNQIEETVDDQAAAIDKMILGSKSQFRHDQEDEEEKEE